MQITDMFEQLDSICVDTFGVEAVLNPQDGGELIIKGVFALPSMLEEMASQQGASVVRFFVRLVDIDPLPRTGDTVTINDQDVYDIFAVDADNAGSGTLRMRKRARND